MMEDEAEEDYWDDILQSVVATNSVIASTMDDDDDDRTKIDHRILPREPRKQYKHSEAHHCIYRDYLGPEPLFGDQFAVMFRLSSSRFQRMMEDIAATGNSFFLAQANPNGEEVASFEARLLLPLKCLAYGVPPHCFCDYFQMSFTLAKQACDEFDKAIKSIYQEEYLRLPTKEDVWKITYLHKCKHGIDGLFGSLDCMHTYWKNCPVAWQGSFSGKEKRPSIVLEAVADHNLWFWHAAYGYAGTLNDLNILNISPLLEAWVDGSFCALEDEVTPYKIGDQEFNLLFVLVDGIYPRFTRFLKGFKEPISRPEKRYTTWQESARKDVERAFGVLQCMWQWIARPIHLRKMDAIAERVACCMIMHNMCVSDRIMDGDVRARYDPANGRDMPPQEVPQPSDLLAVQGGALPVSQRSVIGVTNVPPHARNLVTRGDRFKDLSSKEEHARLSLAVQKLLWSKAKK